MDTIVEAIVKTYGTTGLFMIAPIVGLWFLWRKYLSRETEFSEALAAANTKTLTEAQARVEDSKKVTEVLTELVSEQSGLNKETNMMLAHISSTLDRANVRGA